MKIDKQIIKKYTLELTEQEYFDIIDIMQVYNDIYSIDLINDEFIDDMVVKSNKIGNITARTLLDSFEE